MAANHQETMRPPNVHNEAPPTHASHENDVINIQLPYDPQAPTKPELWSGSFYPISLHGFIEHFTSDSKNIKVTLNFLAKYIQNKQINGGKGNDLNDFDGMGDAIWNFISVVYAARWNTLYTDQKTNTLRSKISTINKAPPLSPLLAKSKKEINVISKYFQSKKSMVDNNVQGCNVNSGKSYAQVFKTSVNTLEVLKIKKTFPSLNAQKIDQVNNIVNSQIKPKPHIKITTKGLSRKQIIIPMSGDNVTSFMWLTLTDYYAMQNLMF